MKIEWDKTGERYYEAGTKRGVLYPQKTDATYDKGVAWNGLTGVTESPSGAEPTDLYADDSKYASMRSAETFGGTIEAYTYPDEFALCDGSKELTTGVMVGQQGRRAFGLSYVTQISNDVNVEAYKIHIVYGATASPSEKGYTTINDSPDAITFSWTFETTPVNVTGMKPTSIITIDTRKVSDEKIKALEDILYGTSTNEPRLPLPDEVKEIIEDVEDNTIEG